MLEKIIGITGCIVLIGLIFWGNYVFNQSDKELLEEMGIKK